MNYDKQKLWVMVLLYVKVGWKHPAAYLPSQKNKQHDFVADC